jgi:hypothetical protein
LSADFFLLNILMPNIVCKNGWRATQKTVDLGEYDSGPCSDLALAVTQRPRAIGQSGGIAADQPDSGGPI